MPGGTAAIILEPGTFIRANSFECCLSREHVFAWGNADIILSVFLLDGAVSRQQRRELADLAARALYEDLGFSYRFFTLLPIALSDQAELKAATRQEGRDRRVPGLASQACCVA